MAFHRNDGHRQKPGGEIPRRRLGALEGVGVEANRAVFGEVVFREQSLFFQPQAEILAHGGFQHRAAQGKLCSL